jgi:alkylation response protein AidB-like acyl-CoA dehydrogenase
MDFELNPEQGVLLNAAETLLARSAGTARAEQLVTLSNAGEQSADGYDHDLERALNDAGFTGVALVDGMGPLEATLLTSAVARQAGCVSFGANAIVAAQLLGRTIDGPVALADTALPGPVRFAAQAVCLLVADGEQLRIIETPVTDLVDVDSNFGYPMATLPTELLAAGDIVEGVSAHRMRAWWQLAASAEAVGCMQAALSFTIDYLKNRRQFGRSIASFQAVQHRLANCAVMVESARWLCAETASHNAPGEAAAATATHTMEAATLLFDDTHQLSGAIGFTTEHALHHWTMRLQTLKLELGGAGAHARSLARLRWTDVEG